MANLALSIILWIVLIGFVTFCLLYAFLARPWQDHMGRHMLVFELGFALAFAYAIESQHLPYPQRTYGWLVVLSIIAALIWWRVIILIKYQIAARKLENADEE